MAIYTVGYRKHLYLDYIICLVVCVECRDSNFSLSLCEVFAVEYDISLRYCIYNPLIILSPFILMFLCIIVRFVTSFVHTIFYSATYYAPPYVKPNDITHNLTYNYYLYFILIRYLNTKYQNGLSYFTYLFHDILYVIHFWSIC